MTAKYRISPNAKFDLERIGFYGLEHWGEAAADDDLAAFFGHFEELARQPLLYPESDVREGYRRSICGQDSVFYLVNNERVEIMAIIGKQDSEIWL